MAPARDEAQASDTPGDEAAGACRNPEALLVHGEQRLRTDAHRGRDGDSGAGNIRAHEPPSAGPFRGPASDGPE